MLQLVVHPGREKLIEQNRKVLENKQEIKVFGNTETVLHHNSNFKQCSQYSENRKQIQKIPDLKKQQEFPKVQKDNLPQIFLNMFLDKFIVNYAFCWNLSHLYLGQEEESNKNSIICEFPNNLKIYC